MLPSLLRSRQLSESSFETYDSGDYSSAASDDSDSSGSCSSSSFVEVKFFGIEVAVDVPDRTVVGGVTKGIISFFRFLSGVVVACPSSYSSSFLSI